MIKQEKIDISELRFFEIKKEQAPENTNIPSNTDWEQVVQATNDWFDRCVETLTPETLSGKIANLEIVASELEAWANEPAAAKQYPLIPAVLRRCVASYISSIPNSLKRAGIAQCFHEMARTEYALLAWKKQHEGELPGDLNELVPKIIDRLPLDPFTGKPFDYRIISGGHLLYSPGANQELDGRGEKFSAVFGTGDTDRYRSFFDYDNDDIAMVIIDDAF